MRHALIMSGVLLLAACGGQDDGEPCVMQLNVFDMTSNIYVGNTIPVDMELSVRSGKCNVNQNVLWESSNTSVAEIISSDNNSAQVRARARGNVYIKAWLALTPKTRDSTLLTIITAVDTTQAALP